MELSDLANDEREKMVKRDGTDAVDGPIVAKKRIPVEADFLFGHCTVPGKQRRLNVKARKIP